MIQTRRKQASKGLKDGKYASRITSVSQIPGGLKISFKTTQNSIDLVLPLPSNNMEACKQSYLKLGQMAFLGGLESGSEVKLSQLINLKLTITVKSNKIIEIQ